MKNHIKLTIMALAFTTILFPGLATAQTVPDCSGEGPNLVGLVWSSGEFSDDQAAYQVVTGTLYVFNPSGGDVRGWELSLEFPPDDISLLQANLFGNAINVGQGNDFIVGLGDVLEPDGTGAVAIGELTFFLYNTNPINIYAVPTTPASIPDNLALLTGEFSEMVTLYPVGGTGNPIAALNGATLDYCQGGTTNQPPVAVDDQVDADEDTPATFDILDNDYDPDGGLNPASVVFVSEPSQGGLFEYLGSGSVSYTPAAEFSGTESIDYRVSDLQGAASNTATITVTVAPVNDPPVAVADTVQTLEDTGFTFDILDNDVDIDGTLDPATVQFVSEPSAGGTFTDNGDGTVTYTPLPDFFGADSILYRVRDNNEALSGEAAILVSVTPVDDPPVAVPETAQTDEDTAVVIDLAANDYDIDSTLDPGGLWFSSPSAGGSLINNGDGTVTFTPAADFFGIDTFEYAIPDLQGVFSATVVDTVVIASVNDAPVAHPDTVQTLEDTPVTFSPLANDVDIDGVIDPLTLEWTSASGAGGAFLDNGDGTVTYTPPLDHFGLDAITYRVRDNNEALSNEAVIFVNIEAVNDAPVAVWENTETPEDAAVDLAVLTNDYDVDSELDPASLQLGETSLGGTVVHLGDGVVRYTPAPDFSGPEFFSYTVADIEGAVSAAAVDTVFVTPVNDAPVAYPDTAATQTEVPVQIAILDNDVDIDSALDPASVVLGPPSQGGSFQADTEGLVTYTSQPGFSGWETCTYTVADQEGAVCAEPGLIAVLVESAGDDPPVFSGIPDQQAPFGEEFAPLDLTPYVTDEDVPGLTWQASGNQELSVVVTGGVAQVKTADPSWFGHEVITFTATDTAQQSGSVDVTFVIGNGYQFWVEVLAQGQDTFYTAAAPGATDGFDPLYDRVYGGGVPSLQLDRPAGWDQYAYVRHQLAGQENEVAITYVDDELYEIPYGRYRPVPPGEFCIYECIWNADTQQYDCGLDCQYQLEGGRTYTLIWNPQGVWADIALVEEEDDVYLRAATVAAYDGTSEARQWDFDVVFDNSGSDVPATSTLQFFTSFLPDAGIGMKLYDQAEGTLVELVHTDLYGYEVPAGSLDTRRFTFYLGTPEIAGDTDGDGVPDDVDECPGEDASFFDRDGDGCIDPVIGGRHIEYWADGTFPLAYVVHTAGVPDIADGSDFDAITEGFAAWDQIPGCEVTTQYLGTTDNPIANSYDGINTVTFSDDEYLFPSGVIAVGLSTSYLTPDAESGARPGQILDVDMIFNPLMDFRTETAGTPDGVYLEGVVVHEAGHMLGLSHTAIQSSTMFYVLPPDSTAVSLEPDDRLAMLKAYYEQSVYDEGSLLQGTVTDGRTGEPVAGAIVFVINAATGDTTACDYTLPGSGRYQFLGLPDGSYNVAIHPLDGSSTIGYLFPGNINSLINATADVLFEPEYWDAAESSSDDGTVATPVSVATGSVTTADLVTNIDRTGPVVLAVSPPDGSTDVPISVGLLIRFDEAIDPASLPGNFNFSEQGVGTLLLGNASLVEDGRTLAYVPTVNLAFGTTHVLEIASGVTDLYGNPMDTDFTAAFTTEPQPPVALSNLLPRKGVAGSLLVINGAGFDAAPAGNTVTYGGVTWPLLDARSDQLVIQVPGDVEPGTANIQVTAFGETSNELSYTVLAEGSGARGVVTAQVDLFALPRQVEVSPDGDQVFVATGQGLAAVDVSDPAAPVLESVPVTGGLNRLDVTPDGQTVYGISRSGLALVRLGTQPVAELQSLALDFAPTGIVIDPGGRRAYLATDFREIQVWDIDENSLNFQAQVGALPATAANLTGAMTCDPAGRYLLALDAEARLLVFDLETYQLAAEVPLLGDPRDVVVDPQGQRAYVTDNTGSVSLVSLDSFTKFLDIPCGGELLGLAGDPMGSFLYAVNHQLNNLDVIDLRSTAPTYRTIAARIAQPVNPVDVAVSPDGLYAYTACESDQRLTISSVGTGPVLDSLSRRSGPVGSTVVLAGSGFTGAGVTFGGVPAVIGRATDTSLTVTVPVGAASGPVMVLGDGPGEVSGSIDFQVLDASPEGNLRVAAVSRPAGDPGLTGAMAVAPGDRVVAAGGLDGRIHLLNIDPNSTGYHQFIGRSEPLGGPVEAVAPAPDGLSVYAVTGAVSAVTRLNTSSAAGDLGGVLGSIELTEPASGPVAVSPDGRLLLIAGDDRFHLVDWPAGTEQTIEVASPTRAVGFLPDGLHALAATDIGLHVIDLVPESPNYGLAVSTLGLNDPIAGLAFSPDGSLAYVLTGPGDVPGDRNLTVYDMSEPLAPLEVETWPLPSGETGPTYGLALGPVGDRAVVALGVEGLVLVDLPGAGLNPQPGVIDASGRVGLDWTGAGRRIYAACAGDGSVISLDFNQQPQIAKVWGDQQTGQAGQILGSTLRVRVTDQITGGGLPGVPVTFSIDTLSVGAAETTYGHFVTEDPEAAPTTLTVASNDLGFAEVKMNLGLELGPRQVDATCLGTAGSPLNFTETAVPAPADIAFELLESKFAPLGGSSQVAVSTAVQITFSKAADTATIGPDDFFLSADGGATAVPAVMGFAGGGTTASLTPVGVLAYGTAYTVTVGPDIVSGDGQALADPQTFTFTTAAAPAAAQLTGISPPGAPLLAPVMISGSGFNPDPGLTAVYFGGLPSTITSVEPDFILTKVPLGAGEGVLEVQVTVDGAPTNTLPFSVFTPTTDAPDEVVLRVPSGSSSRAATISPDGAMLYTVAAESDLVVPLDLVEFETTPSIPVGDMPWAIDAHPDGKLVYVANRMSGDVSVIDADRASPTYHQTIAGIPAGAGPLDILVTPAGDRVLVANEISEDLAVIDGDSESASFNYVINRVPAGSAAKAVTVSPDGARIYLGTDEGYIVIGSVDYGVIRQVPTGSSVKTVTVSPDGALLVLVDTGGGVTVFDIAEGSPTEDQVVARVPAGASVKTATVSPDGARLYAVMEEGDVINVYALDVGTSAEVTGEYDTRPVTELTLLQQLIAGQNPQLVIFDPTDITRFLVPSAGDGILSVFDDEVPVSTGDGTAAVLDGSVVTADGNPLVGAARINLYAAGSGELSASLTADSGGRFAAAVPAGRYIASLVPPEGYRCGQEERPVTLAAGQRLDGAWTVAPRDGRSEPRSMAWWKYELALALQDRGGTVVDRQTLCGELQQAAGSGLDGTAVFGFLAGEPCAEGLADLFNYEGRWTMDARARQQLGAILLNTAAGHLDLQQTVSEDGATALQAVLYCDWLLGGEEADHATAWSVARALNTGETLAAGAIPDDFRDAMYSPIATRFHLDQSYPNPFNPQCRIRFGVPRAGRVQLKVFDVSGRLVRTLVDDNLRAGTYIRVWDGTDNRGRSSASGVYFYRMQTADFTRTRKMLLMK